MYCDMVVDRSAKAGFYAGKWKKFGNLCYVIGALQGFVGHKNRDLNIRVSELTALPLSSCAPVDCPVSSTLGSRTRAILSGANRSMVGSGK